MVFLKGLRFISLLIGSILDVVLLALSTLLPSLGESLTLSSSQRSAKKADDASINSESKNKRHRKGLLSFGFFFGVAVSTVSFYFLSNSTVLGPRTNKALATKVAFLELDGKEYIGEKHVEHLVALLQLNEDLHQRVLETRLESDESVLLKAFGGSVAVRVTRARASIVGMLDALQKEIDAAEGSIRATVKRAANTLNQLQEDLVADVARLVSQHSAGGKGVEKLYIETLHKVSNALLQEALAMSEHGSGSEEHRQSLAALQNDHWIIHLDGFRRGDEHRNLRLPSVGAGPLPQSAAAGVSLFFAKSVRVAKDDSLRKNAGKCASKQMLMKEIADCKAGVEALSCDQEIQEEVLQAVGMKVADQDRDCCLMEMLRFLVLGASRVEKLAQQWKGSPSSNTRSTVLDKLRDMALQEKVIPRVWIVS